MDWEPWLSTLETAARIDDREAASSILKDLWRFGFHERRARDAERWDRLFVVLAWLLESPDAGLRSSAEHYVFVVIGNELGPRYDTHTREDRQRRIVHRTEALLRIFERLADTGRAATARFVHALAHVEGLADMAPQPEVLTWIEHAADSDARRTLARFEYVGCRTPWPDARAPTLAALDHADAAVRVAAAGVIGRYYDEGLAAEPPFASIVALITTKDLERSGVAGGLFSTWYTGMRADDFAREGCVNLEEWLFTLLAAPRPSSGSIEFYAHEIFASRPQAIRRLLAMGKDALALEAAVDIAGPVEGMEPVLLALGAEDADDAICSSASHHLARHYRRLHPDGQRRGFVRRHEITGVGELFLVSGRNLDRSLPAVAVLWADAAPRFDDATARAHLDVLLPPNLRGSVLTYGMPGDGASPGEYARGNTAALRYSGGAHVVLSGDSSSRRWTKIDVQWFGAPRGWDPEQLARLPK